MKLDQVRVRLAEVMDPQSIDEWLKSPNPAFDGSPPLQVIERGGVDQFHRMIYQLKTGELL